MVFCFVQKIFFRQHKSQNIIFFCRAKREIFFQNLTLGYMTKILNRIVFFFFHQNQNIFFSNIGNQNIFLEKNHNPPPFKLNGRSLTMVSMNQYISIMFERCQFKSLWKLLIEVLYQVCQLLTIAIHVHVYSFYSTRQYISIMLKRCQFKSDWKLIYGFILIYA